MKKIGLLSLLIFLNLILFKAYDLSSIIKDPVKAFSADLEQRQTVVPENITANQPEEVSGETSPSVATKTPSIINKLTISKHTSKNLTVRRNLLKDSRLTTKAKSRINKGSKVQTKTITNKTPTNQETKLYVAFFGLDKDKERAEKSSRFNTDTIMVFSIDLNNGKTSLLSIPRDTYVSYLGRDSSGKINAAYSLGGKGHTGAAYATKNVGSLIGRNLKYYVLVDMDAVGDLVDLIGGVDIYVENEINLWGKTIKSGYQNLNGKEALIYLRYRGVDGDRGRVIRQQLFFNALLNKLSKMDKTPSNLLRLYKIFSSRTITNLSFEQSLSLVNLLSKSGFKISERYNLPGSGSIKNGIYYWYVNKEQIKERLKDF